MIVAVPDLLITDLLLPGLAGWGLLDHVREEYPPLPVILMSASDLTRWRGLPPRF